MRPLASIGLIVLLSCHSGDWVGHVAFQGKEIDTQNFTGPHARASCEAWQLIFVEKYVYGEDPYEGPRLWVVFSPHPGEALETHTIGPESLQTVRELFGPGVREATSQERKAYDDEIAEKLKAYSGWCSRK
jgi:hypothetical protein